MKMSSNVKKFGRGRPSLQRMLMGHFGTKNLNETISVVEEHVAGSTSSTEAVAKLATVTDGAVKVSVPPFIAMIRQAHKAGRVRKGTTLHALVNRKRGQLAKAA